MDHRLREFYRFMDFYTNSTCTEVSKSLFQKFLLWNDGAFWYNRWDKKFREFGDTFLANRKLAYSNLAITTPAMRIKEYRSRDYTARRQGNIGLTTLLHPRRTAKRLLDSIPWQTYTLETKLAVVKNLLELAGISGEQFLLNTDAVKCVQNVQHFFAEVSEQRDSETLGVCQTTRSIMSGPNISPRALYSLLAPKSRLEDYQDAIERRLYYGGKVANLKRTLFARKPKFHPEVVQLILRKANEWSDIDPSVSKIKSWRNPLTGDMEEVSRRWTLFSRAHLATMFLTLYSSEFSVVQGFSEPRRSQSSSIPSIRYVDEVLKRFTWYYNYSTEA